MPNQIMLLDIPNPGNNSVKGSIISDHGMNIYENLNEFCWLIAVPYANMDFIHDECKEMKLEQIIIVDRGTTKYLF